MKVNDDRPAIKELSPGQTTHGRKGSQEVSAPFRQMLQESSTASKGDVLRELLDRITKQGELVASRTDIGELKKYRQMVKDFLHEAMNSTYATDKESLFDAKGRFKEYSVVKKVDVELEKLTQKVLSEQKDNLAVLEQLGIIRGLLVDLLI